MVHHGHPIESDPENQELVVMLSQIARGAEQAFERLYD